MENHLCCYHIPVPTTYQPKKYYPFQPIKRNQQNVHYTIDLGASTQLKTLKKGFIHFESPRARPNPNYKENYFNKFPIRSKRFLKIPSTILTCGLKWQLWRRRRSSRCLVQLGSLLAHGTHLVRAAPPSSCHISPVNFLLLLLRLNLLRRTYPSSAPSATCSLLIWGPTSGGLLRGPTSPSPPTTTSVRHASRLETEK